MKSSHPNRTRVSEVLETSILDALESILDAAMRTLVAIYPFPADILIPTGEYTVLDAHSDTLTTQIQTLSEALRLYRRCLEKLSEEPPENPEEEPPSFEEIPF